MNFPPSTALTISHRFWNIVHYFCSVQNTFKFSLLLSLTCGLFKSVLLSWASLVAQWLRICLSMQGTWVWALVREDPTCRGAGKPVRHNYRACALEPTSHNYWAHMPRACALQQEKPSQWEARAPQWRVAPARRNYRKPTHNNEDPTQS